MAVVAVLFTSSGSSVQLPAAGRRRWPPPRHTYAAPAARAGYADHRGRPEPAARAAASRRTPGATARATRRCRPPRGRFRRRGEVRLDNRRRRRLPLKRRVHRELHRAARNRVHRHRGLAQRIRRQRHLLQARVEAGRAALPQQEQHRGARHRQVVAVAHLHQGQDRRPLLNDVDAVLPLEQTMRRPASWPASWTAAEAAGPAASKAHTMSATARTFLIPAIGRAPVPSPAWTGRQPRHANRPRALSCGRGASAHNCREQITGIAGQLRS